MYTFSVNRALQRVNVQEQEIVPKSLNLTTNQLFWLGWGQTWCTLQDLYERVPSLQTLLKAFQGETHEAGLFRVNIPLSNLKEFAEDFNCPLGSKLNPEKRCNVWSN